jgi:hypothetical protein
MAPEADWDPVGNLLLAYAHQDRFRRASCRRDMIPLGLWPPGQIGSRILPYGHDPPDVWPLGKIRPVYLPVRTRSAGHLASGTDSTGVSSRTDMIRRGLNADRLKHTRQWMAWEAAVGRALNNSVWVLEPEQTLGSCPRLSSGAKPGHWPMRWIA